MNLRKVLLLIAVLPIMYLTSCKDPHQLDTRLTKVEKSLTDLEQKIAEFNSNILAMSKISDGKTKILEFKEDKQGYILSFTDGSEVKITYGDKIASVAPLISIDEKGNWIISKDGGKTFEVIKGSSKVVENAGITPQFKVDKLGNWLISKDNGQTFEQLKNKDNKPVSAVDGSSVAGKFSFFKDVQYDEAKSIVTFTLIDGKKVEVDVINNFFLKVKSIKDGEIFKLGQKKVFNVELSDVKDITIQAPEGWDIVLTDKELQITSPLSAKDGKVKLSIIAISSKSYVRNIVLNLDLKADAQLTSNSKVWNDFVEQNDDNLLLDFSYAGYKHGEVAPVDVNTLGYTVYNVVDYGAVPNDGKSDREAFLKSYKAALGGAVQKPQANAIIYFPEGEFILHTADDNENGLSVPLILRAGNFILKGAGKDKTTIVMQDPNYPKNASQLWSSPAMIEIKHNSGLSKLTDVSSDAEKGSFSVEVASASSLTVGDWVCLVLENKDANLIAEELAPYTVLSGMTDLSEKGVRVYDYHQIKAIEANKITFEEPIMHKVESKWNWQISKYPHYENVGVEDITFRANAKANFKHHGSWQDDGAYKPINMTRLTNSWMRRVKFVSVSEASSITNCANVSVYDIVIEGNRGHSSIRSQASSRVLIAKVIDRSSGIPTNEKGEPVGTDVVEGIGQFHGVGVAKPSIGTVLWRNEWGTDACFEAHATQPRATLIDKCTGGWKRWRQGGDTSQMPNHLADLTIWNFKSKTAFSGEWIWWDNSSYWWKYLPPIIVGFNGESCQFKEDQMKVNEGQGQEADIESLYEAQLQKRLGFVPAWLNELK